MGLFPFLSDDVHHKGELVRLSDNFTTASESLPIPIISFESEFECSSTSPLPTSSPQTFFDVYTIQAHSTTLGVASLVLQGVP